MSTTVAGAEAVTSSSKPAVRDRSWVTSFERPIAEILPVELQLGARELVLSVASRVAIAERFDAFCGQAFSRPDWTAVASPLIAEIFENEEDLLSELARIPDLIMEMSSGEVTMTCIVASRWAARGETNRLSRMADSMVASNACKNAASVGVMLALAATLAVTRHSRAAQLYNAALPLSKGEHREAISDALQWLAAGRVVSSLSQEEREFWDARLRRPKQMWTWENDEERHALDMLVDRLKINDEAEGLFKAVVPKCWWDVAQRYVTQQTQLSDAVRLAAKAQPDEVSLHQLWSQIDDQSHFVTAAKKWAKKQLDNSQIEQISEQIALAVALRGRVDYDQFQELANRCGVTEQEIHTVVTCLCSGAEPILKQTFYRIEHGARVAICAQEVQAKLRLCKNDQTTSVPEWREWASQVGVAWERGAR